MTFDQSRFAPNPHPDPVQKIRRFDKRAVERLLTGNGPEEQWRVLPYYGVEQPAKRCQRCESRNTKMYAATKSRRMNFRVCLSCGYRDFRCGAIMPSCQKICQMVPVPGRWRCFRHGGKAKVGVVSHMYKGKGYSQDLPTRLAEMVLQAECDPELLSTRREIALLQTRVRECVKLLKSGGAKKQFDEIVKICVVLKEAREKKDIALLDRTLEKLYEATVEGRCVFDAWDDVTRAVKDLAQIQQHEQRWEKDQHEILTAEQAKTLFGTMAAAVAEIVVDSDAKRKIFARFAELASFAPGRPKLLMLPDDARNMSDRVRRRSRKRKREREEMERETGEAEANEDEAGVIDVESGSASDAEQGPSGGDTSQGDGLL